MSQKKNLRADTSLTRFIDGPVIKSDPKLRQHLEAADQLQDAVLIVLDFSARTFEHVSKAMRSIIGYESQEFLNRGTPMAVAITASEEIPYLTAIQSAYVQQARVPGFDSRSLVFHEYSYTLIHQDGKKIPISSTGVVLTYGPHHQLGVGVGFQVPRHDGYENSLTSCKSILKEIKLRHNEVYSHSQYTPPNAPSPKHHCDEIIDNITTRERQVLGMMAQGHSSSQIATELSITTNTVESHRKKLLEKFQARNAAELIHKASKVFWLE